MLKTAIFAAGLVGGAVALPASVIYIKPVRTAASKMLAKGAVGILRKDAGVREIILEQGSEFLAYVALINEAQKKAGK
ncbi:hypothetical protein SEA_MAKAI_47 [Arthrobacter phage Makai]|nr:hypothetical protein SEA_MAKAI_47 [Arthrobacter phage Makai]QPX62509.1 membrane protein [Arthrobacter phage Truckee]